MTGKKGPFASHRWHHDARHARSMSRLLAGASALVGGLLNRKPEQKAREDVVEQEDVSRGRSAFLSPS